MYGVKLKKPKNWVTDIHSGSTFYHSHKHSLETPEVPHSRLRREARNTHTHKILHLSKKEGEDKEQRWKIQAKKRFQNKYCSLSHIKIITLVMAV